MAFGIFSKIKKFLNSTKNKTPFFNAAVEIPTDKEKIKIVPVGYFPAHHDGAHEITKQNIIEMAENIKNGGTDIMFDYGHESIWSSGAIAAGWSARKSAEAREDGLYIDYPEFTEAATARVNAKEYRYFSPAYFLEGIDKKGKNIGAVLHSVALVNKPYMDKEINHIGNSQKQQENKMNPQILKFLGLSETATEAEVEAKLNSLRVENKLNTDASVDDILDAIKNSSTNQTNALEDRVKALENDKKLGKIEALVNSAIDDGKILPAQKQVYVNAAEKDFAGTKTILDAIQKNSAVPSKNSLPENVQQNSNKPPKYDRTALYEAVKNSTIIAKKA